MGAVAPARWRGPAVVALGFLMVMISAGPVFYAYGIFANDFAATFGASRSVVNLALTSVLVVSGLASMPIGWLAARVELRWLALGGVLGTALGLALVGTVTAMWQVVMIYATLISGADVLLGMLVINMLIASWFERQRGLAIGIAALGASAAAILFPPLSAWLRAEVGWRHSFLLFGAMTLLLAPLVLWLARPPAGGIPARQRRQDGEAPPPAGPPPGLRLFAATADFWIITIGVGTLMGFNGAVMASMVSYGVARGMTTAAAAGLVSLVGFSAMAGKLLFGLLADRIDLRWALRLGLLAGILSMGLFALAPGNAMLYAAALVYGLALGAMLPVWGALTAQCFGLPWFGRALGATRAAMTPFNFACPLLVGAVYDIGKDYRPAWAALGLLAAVALAMTFVKSRKKAALRGVLHRS